MINDAPLAGRAEFSFPPNATSKPGDFVSASRNVEWDSKKPTKIYFREREDYTGPTAGYHFKQLLINDKVVWEEDVAGGTNGWREVSLELPPVTSGRMELTFRLFDKQGVGNFPMHWQLADLHGDGNKLSASLEQPEQWGVKHRGAFEAGFGEALTTTRSRWHLPFIVMTAAQDIEFRLRHGEPVSPERRAAWIKMSRKRCATASAMA